MVRGNLGARTVQSGQAETGRDDLGRRAPAARDFESENLHHLQRSRHYYPWLPLWRVLIAVYLTHGRDPGEADAKPHFRGLVLGCNDAELCNPSLI